MKCVHDSPSICMVPCLMNIPAMCLIDVTLACSDANSKLVEVVTDVDAEKRFDNSLVQM